MSAGRGWGGVVCVLRSQEEGCGRGRLPGLLREARMMKGQGPQRRCPWRGPGEALRRGLPAPSSPPLGWTVGDDPQGLFKQHREQELEERKKLYRSALLTHPPSAPAGPC